MLATTRRSILLLEIHKMARVAGNDEQQGMANIGGTEVSHPNEINVCLLFPGPEKEEGESQRRPQYPRCLPAVLEGTVKGELC
jgi:hypothetical protein